MIKDSDYSLRRDFLSLSLFLFIIGSLTVSHIAGLSKIMILYGFILMTIFSIYLTYNRLLRLPPEVVAYLAWIIWTLSGAAVAIDKALFIEKLMTVIQIGFLLFLVSGIISLKKNVSTVMLAIIIGGVILLLSSFYTGEFFEAGEFRPGARVEGLAGNANGFAYHMMFIVYGVFYFWKKKTSVIWRIVLSSIVGLSVIGIVYSGSRTGLIGFIVFLLLWWILCGRKRLSEHPIKIYAVLMVISFALYRFVDYILFSSFLGYRIQHLQDSSIRLRLQFYKDGFDMIIHNPIFGVGLSNFSMLSSLTGAYSHSNYIEIASTTGIIGFILFFSIYFIMWRRLTRIKKIYHEPQALYTIGLFKAAIITMLIQSFSTVNYSSKPAWIFLAVVIGYSWSLERSLLRSISLHKKYLRRLEEDEPHDLYR
jgi:O-antigen ligase